MDKNEAKAYIARRVARELHDGDIVNLGIGLPTLVAEYVPAGVSIVLHSENGMIGTRYVSATEAEPYYVTDAGGSPAGVNTGGCYLDSATSFGLIRGGHVSATVLGAMQVDENGDMANWMVPGGKLTGMGGAMDLLANSKNVIVAMLHTDKGSPKIVRKCSLPLTAVHCVNTIVTEMCLIRVRPEGLVLCEYNPEYSLDEIKQATGAQLIMSPELKPMS